MKSLELLQQVLARMPATGAGWVICTRSDLTRKLCHHPNRRGSVTTADLDRAVPRLVAAGLASELPRPGKPPAYVFRPVTLGERLQRNRELQAEHERWLADNADFIARAAFKSRVLAETRLLSQVGPGGGEPARLNPLAVLGAEYSTDVEKMRGLPPLPPLPSLSDRQATG